VIYQLEPRDYEKVRPLYAAWRPYLVIFAVIEGRCPGHIYVDDRENPRTALLWDHAEGELYLAGEGRDAALGRPLNDCIRHRIRPHAGAHLPDLSEYTLYCDPAAWGNQIDVVLEGLTPMAHRRRLYTLEELRVDWRSQVPEGYRMVRIDEAIFCQEDLKGMDTMKEWVLGDWRSAADFAEQELGFCLTHGEELVSWCASEYTCEPTPGKGKMCHVGIYTCEAYRRRGFATLVASATVERCLAGGVERVGWHCWEANAASAATAQKVGFALARDLPVYNGCWNQFDNLLLQAHYHAQANRMQEAVACWERAFAMWEGEDPEALCAPHVKAHPDTVAWCYYAAGRTRARWGDGEIALAHLHRAVDNGWRDGKRLREDERLSSLHGTSGWDRLLSRLVSQ
jgi:GNAT superfamily N-acetyltransferase